MKKIRTSGLVSLLLTLVLLSATAVSARALPPDVSGQPYEAAVAALADKNIITGDVDGNYYPDTNLTRAQFCTIIVKAMQAPTASVEGTATQNARRSNFPDLSGYGWAEGYISYAVEKNVVNGYPDATFKPGNNVTMNELITMTLRAAGYTDASLGGVWPGNYIGKAVEIGALQGIPTPLPVIATKWMAAQLVYNMLSSVEKANVKEESSSSVGGSGSTGGSDTAGSGSSGGDGSEQPAQTAPTAPTSTGLTYVGNGKFDGDILTFAGKDIATDVQILTYKLRADYSSDMKISDKAEDFIIGNIYRYKNVETPAWYQVDKGKVSKIIIPNDVGFTGYAYSVINNIVMSSDGEGNTVKGFVTLSAGRDVTWLASSNLGSLLERSDCLNGTVFELRLRGGKVMSIAAADGSTGTPAGKVVKEVGTKGFTEIVDKTGNALKFGNDIAAEIKDKATIYYYNKETEKYSPASMGEIRKGSKVRLYDVSDDKEESADIVVVEEQ